MRIQISAASEAGGSAPNEDHFLASSGWALVLDGITRYPDDGCVHDVPWFASRLGSALARGLAGGVSDLRAVLATAVEDTARGHERTCDLANPVSPGATVAIARLADAGLDWLVLGDCTVAWRGACEARAETDARLAALADTPAAEDVGGVRRYPVDYIAAVRNRPGGFWVASSDPRAADRARVGTVPVEGLGEVLLCTDGLSRLVERFEHSWDRVLDLAVAHGPAPLLGRLRRLERAMPGPGGKRHDDATGVLLRFGTD